MSQPTIKQEFLSAVPDADWDAIAIEFDDDRPTVVHPIMSKAKRLTEDQILDIILDSTEAL